jgi:hypothetical protein
LKLEGRAVAKAVSRWLSTVVVRVRIRAEHVMFVVDKAAVGQVFFPSNSVPPANHDSTNFIIIITRGWHNRPIDGRNAEWTQLDSNPHYTNLLKKYI